MRSAFRCLWVGVNVAIDRWLHLLVMVMGVVEWLRGEAHWGITWMILSLILERVSRDDAS